MLNMEKESKLEASDVIRSAVSFFGPDGLGLTVAKNEDCCASFNGGGGFVFVTVAQIEDRKKTKVTVEGREWDEQIKNFMASL
jgi:hypothetical protein